MIIIAYWMFNLHRYFLLDPGVVFLNHGSFGATPRPVFRAYQRWQRELERQPVEFLGRRHNDLMHQARSVLADFLCVEANDLVYTSNVTVALNIVARSLGLGPGDEVLATDHEYGALDRVWRFLARKHGFIYINQPVPVPLTAPQQVVELLWKGVTECTRVIFLSHITSSTAMIFPVAEICQRARRCGILTIVDGAHAPGQLPLRLEALGADFYGGNLHKWLCAPKGAGFLYARQEVQHLLEPLVVSWGYEAEFPSPSRFIDYHEWSGTRDISAFLAVPAAIEFQRVNDWENVRNACHALVRQAQAEICSLTGLPAFHPDTPDWYAQMATAPLPDALDIQRIQKQLYDEHHIEIPLLRWNGWNLIRVSVQGYNSSRDVDALLEALRVLLA